MKIGILGTGMVGNTIGSKLILLGHDVKMGSRTPDNAKAAEWVKKEGTKASQGTFADAAAFGEMLFNCTAGGASPDVLKLAGAGNLKGKTVIDVSNPLDFSKGFPPSLHANLSNTTSVGEELQKAHPEAKVVKTLNTVTCNLMVNAGLVQGDHDMFICGNDAEAKSTVTDLLKTGFGWKSVIDMGDITNARALEMYLPLWVRLYGVLKTPNFNIKVLR